MAPLVPALDVLVLLAIGLIMFVVDKRAKLPDGDRTGGHAKRLRDPDVMQRDDAAQFFVRQKRKIVLQAGDRFVFPMSNSPGGM